MLALGDFIRRSRESRKLSKRQLSINAGLSQSYVGKLEAGEIDPSFKAVARLLVELGLDNREIALLVRREGRRRD